MHKINRLVFKLKHNSFLCSKRLLSAKTNENSNKLSSRQRSWQETQQKYSEFPNILYSSSLELTEGHMSYGLRRSLWSKPAAKKFIKANHSIEKEVIKPNDVPIDWMEDYEFYEGAKENQTIGNNLGTADATIAASEVPCNGCGAHLHCMQHTRPGKLEQIIFLSKQNLIIKTLQHKGFLPVEIFKGRTEKELKSIICQRCHFLKHYNIALDIEVSAESYVQTIARIQNEFALAIVLVDLLDFPCSLWPGMHELLGPKRPVFIVGNKVDLLPRDSNSYLEHVKQCLKDQIIKSGFDRLNIKHVSLLSAKTGYGVEELITQLQKIWAYNGDVYLLGCTNVGKSSLFNILLHSDYCRPDASNLVAKATTCPWPGTTLQMLKFPIHRPSEIRVYERFKRLKSEQSIRAEKELLRKNQARKTGNTKYAVPMGEVGRTFVQPDDVADAFAMSQGSQPITSLNERSREYKQAKWVYDTPGVMHPQQITNLLTAQELRELQPSKMIAPRSFRLKVGMSLFVAGLARLDFVQCQQSDLDWIQIFLFSSFKLPTMIVKTENATEIYEKYLNTPLMHLPAGSEQRMATWPGLQCHSQDLLVKGERPKAHSKDKACSADITLSSVGWVGLQLPPELECTFKAWTPLAKGIYLRTPSLIPYAERLIGKRIRNSLAYNVSRPFVFKK